MYYLFMQASCALSMQNSKIIFYILYNNTAHNEKVKLKTIHINVVKLIKKQDQKLFNFKGGIVKVVIFKK